MRTRRRTTIEDLRLAIDCLPRTTREAMLDAIASSQIIAGAYTHDGGICPMLAAHRRGGRTNLISFARAWDRFVFRGARVAEPRPATPRELLVLRSHLEASLLAEDAPDSELATAIDAHRELLARRQEQEHDQQGDRDRGRDRERPRPGDPYRGPELDSSPGWRWMRIVRSYDEYRQALAKVQPSVEALEPERDTTLAR